MLSLSGSVDKSIMCEENNGLLFEAVSFLRYLYEEYGA